MTADYGGPQFDAPILACLQTIFDRHAGPDRTWNKQQAEAFFHHIQGDNDSQQQQEELDGGLDFDHFVRYMTSPAAEALAPAPAAQTQDMSWPLNSYFVSSSHNTYLEGNQLTSDASTEAYKKVLLRSCRCIEIDVWDGGERYTGALDEDDGVEAGVEGSERSPKEVAGEKVGFRLRTMMKVSSWVTDKLLNEKGKRDMAEIQDNWSRMVGCEPRVLHGHTLTKEISFRDVCKTVKEYAFQTSDLPVVVSLEVHCSPEQQEMMVAIMEEIWAEHLLPPVGLEDTEHIAPSLAELRNKILVKVKYVPPKQRCGGDAEDAATTEDTEGLEGIEGLEPEDGAPAKQAKPPKIIEILSKMGIFTRGVSFKAMEQAEAEMPHHIFSLSEGMVDNTHQQTAEKFFNHNKRFLMRSYPAGTRVDSSNLDPAGHWRKGIQFAALNWQNWDKGMMMNDAMFDGSRGYVLKPDGYREEKEAATPGPAISHRTLHRLAVHVLAVQHLPLPDDLRSSDELHPYLVMDLSVEPHPLTTTKREPCSVRTQVQQGVNPDFAQEVLTFHEIEGVTPELSFVTFRVWNDQPGLDPVLAGACLRLDRMKSGYRFIRLKNSQGMATDSILLVKIEKAMS
ncbi:1-phosphatidylinositol-4-5-bisphosphate phosphodiesterase delta-1 [Apiospora rasikravindrae]|uniref:Phosphoinositide phospholipase C n=1 Tax=Apiospora rasikravindrae TaxID=990691 RepID=A0ABR1TE75_9PEZI